MAAVLGVEGTQDEVEFISEAQWHISDRVFLKLNNAVGLTSKAADWAPENRRDVLPPDATLSDAMADLHAG